MTARHESPAAVAFDCDSTLSRLEGIDELAVRVGRAHEIVPLTQAAMDGRMTLEEVYARRMEILRPNRQDVSWLGQRYADTIVEGALQAIGRLSASGAAVYVVSGGCGRPWCTWPASSASLRIASTRLPSITMRKDTMPVSRRPRL